MEAAGFIRRIPAFKVTKKGRNDFTATEIIIVPIDCVDNSEYHKAIDRFIDENKYVVVNYSDKVRRVIGSGKKKEYSKSTKAATTEKGANLIKAETTYYHYRLVPQDTPQANVSEYFGYDSIVSFLYEELPGFEQNIQRDIQQMQQLFPSL